MKLLEECASADFFNEYFDACVFELIHINKKDIAQKNAILKVIHNAHDFESAFGSRKEKFMNSNFKSYGILQAEIPIQHSENRRQSLNVYEHESLQTILQQNCETIKSIINEPSKAITTKIFGITKRLISIVFITSIIFNFL